MKVSYTLSGRSSKCILDEDTIWLRVKKVYEILKPIGSWIFELEGDKPYISLIPQAFKEIRERFEKLLVGSPLCKNEALTPLHYAANILDPRYYYY